MVTHVLLFRLPEELGAAERSEVLASIEQLAGIPQVDRMSWGANVGTRSQGYTHAAVIELASWEALQAYQENPEHLRLAGVFNRFLEPRLVVDYESDSSGISA